MKITLHPYSSHWKTDFEREQQSLQSILPAGSNVEHIGSTAVEGLGAKPVIDIMIGIVDFTTVSMLIPGIVALHYSYIPEFENVMPERRFFTKDENEIRVAHIHMVELHSDFWKRHLIFRDHLRNNIADRDAYFKLKQELAQREWNNGAEYANAKTDFIRKIMNNIV